MGEKDNQVNNSYQQRSIRMYDKDFEWIKNFKPEMNSKEKYALIVEMLKKVSGNPNKSLSDNDKYQIKSKLGEFISFEVFQEELTRFRASEFLTGLIRLIYDGKMFIIEDKLHFFNISNKSLEVDNIKVEVSPYKKGGEINIEYDGRQYKFSIIPDSLCKKLVDESVVPNDLSVKGIFGSRIPNIYIIKQN